MSTAPGIVPSWQAFSNDASREDMTEKKPQNKTQNSFFLVLMYRVRFLGLSITHEILRSYMYFKARRSNPILPLKCEKLDRIEPR